jgi:dTDP-4-amino-4,6-dideoxygalactose transaminase
VSEDLFERGLCLPSGAQMTEEDLERVVKVIKNCYRPPEIKSI